MKYLYLWGVGIVIVLSFIDYYLIYYYGRYVKKHYPDRYMKQLTPPNATYPNLPFPFNFGEPYARGKFHIKKIIEVANAVNDKNLYYKANRLYKIENLSFVIAMVIILTFALLGYWLFPM